MDDPIEMTHHGTPLEAAKDDKLQGDQQEPAKDPLAEAQPRSRIRIAAILLALSLSLFIAALDMTIVATAIPTIAADLQAASGYLWIGGAYLLASAAGAPLWAKLSDIWGRKAILLAAVTLFAISSIVCALARDITMLIVGRAFQGTAGGGLLQLVNIVVSDIFSMRERSLYLGLCEFIWALAGGIGPILGGVLTQLVSWRWIFWINLPCSGLAFILILLFLDVHNPKTAISDGLKAVDWFGSISIIGLTVMLLLGLNFGGTTFPWDSPKVVCLIVFGCLMSVFFVLSEKRLAQYPLMPLKLLQERSNVMSLLVDFVHGFVFIAGEYYLPLYFQAVEEASPIRSGVLILPFILSETAMGVMIGVLIHKTGRYLELMWIGMILMTIGFGMFIHLDATSPLSQIVGFQIVAGLGSGMLFEPPLIAIQAHVSQQDVATATATHGFILALATSISVVVGGVIFQNGMLHSGPALRSAGLNMDVVQDFAGDDAAANVMAISTISDTAQKLVVKEAFASSLRNMWILYTCVSFLGVVASAFVKRRVLSKEHVETRTGLVIEKPPAAVGG
ncbi:MAG: hypothetical protein LQ346_009047 [Caloplaca aetnensis]|nr:MAG: hypothetical protein LQ346_009047 [Caloplaca aetnensis]